MNKDLSGIKLVFSDVDGVLTDGGLYYAADGEALKKFNVKDGLIARALREQGLRLGVLTGRHSPQVQARFGELDFDYIIQGCPDKLGALRRVLDEAGLAPADVAYIGDDLNDRQVLQAVGFSACPADAVEPIRSRVDFVCSKNGGQGAFREFADYILGNR